jgi:hypothetical protein
MAVSRPPVICLNDAKIDRSRRRITTAGKRINYRLSGDFVDTQINQLVTLFVIHFDLDSGVEDVEL